MLKTNELDYPLPETSIAIVPAEPRDTARLMTVGFDGAIQHRTVRDFPTLLRSGDLIVLNTTRVLPARFVGVRGDSESLIEGLYLGPARTRDAQASDRRWIVMLKGKRLKQGLRVVLGANHQATMELLGRSFEEPSAWCVRVESACESDVALLEVVGMTPLPPYILAARRRSGTQVDDARDRHSYQTVFASSNGSVAAPTAGLHLTTQALAQLVDRGVLRCDVVLHVGTGTFKPVETECVEDHPIHEEWCSMSPEAREAIIRAKREGRRVICIGTTAARAVETFASLADPGIDHATTRILITPGYRWKWTDAILTNFHLPRSTLMAMIAAGMSGGISTLKHAYNLAIESGYRFYSYGDAMFLEIPLDLKEMR